MGVDEVGARLRAARTQLLAGFETAKTAAVAGLLRLPAPVRRRLAGAPIEIEGERLDLDTQLVLRMQAVAREPVVERLPVPQGRRVLVAQSRLAGGRQPIGEVRECRVAGLPGRLYVPRGRVVREAGAGDPLLLFFHGGGWVYGDLESHDATCRRLSEAAGVRVLAVDYRLAPEHPWPAAYDDALAALAWTREHAAQLGADPDRIAVGGDSAGGNLAALAAIAAAERGWALRLQLLIYPATDLTRSSASHATFGEGFYLSTAFMDLCAEAYLPRPDDRVDPRASPLFADLPEGLAPAYVATAGFDPLRDEGEAYAAKLADAGVPTVVRRFGPLIHGFVNWVELGEANRAAVTEIAEALADGMERAR